MLYTSLFYKRNEICLLYKSVVKYSAIFIPFVINYVFLFRMTIEIRHERIKALAA